MTTTMSVHRIYCSFTGKEKDSETGYYYFGARYYNPDLSLWLSVDPMADKYPSLSPYNYCAWNPMKLVDPDGNDWYEYTEVKTGKSEIRWTDYHSQEQMDENKINGKYLGVTVTSGGTYYGLMGDKVNMANEGERYRLVKDIDQAIINRSLASSFFKTHDVDFSDVFNFEYGAGADNTRAGYSYAGGEAGITMNNKTDEYGRRTGMMGRFNDMKKTDGYSLGGPGSLAKLKAPRFSINGVGLLRTPEIAAISFSKDPSKAARFEGIYKGLKGRPLLHAVKTPHGWSQTKYR